LNLNNYGYLSSMQINNKHKQRRLSSHNFSSFGKSSCRVAVTPRSLGSPFIPFYHNQVSFCSNSSKARKSIKIHFRSFSSRKSCFLFKKKLKEKFYNFSNKKLKIRTNIRGTKIQYYCGANA